MLNSAPYRTPKDNSSSPTSTSMRQSYPVVIPVAGRGSRLDRLTQLISKELLPLCDDVVLSHILSELEEAGIREVILVSRPEKADIATYIDQIKSDNRFNLQIELIYQGNTPGNGGAVLTAAPVIGSQPFLVVWGDEVFLGPSRVGQLVAAYEELGAPCISLSLVSDADVPKCGIAEGTDNNRGYLQVNGILEKPALGATASRHASVGGFVIEPQVIDILAGLHPVADGEVNLSMALDITARHGPLFGVKIDAEWFETGSYEGYSRAFAAFARSRGLI